MVLWLILALMTSAAVLAVLWPLARGRKGSSLSEASDLSIYKDQLAEIGRDAERGLIEGAEVDAARTEIARRILAAERARSAVPAAAPALSRRRIAAAASVLLVPAIALGLYSVLGSPALPDRPLAARLAAAPETASLDELVQRVEAHLTANPEDGRGWQVLAPIYLRSGRAAEAKTALANAIRLLGSSAEREADLGEAAAAAAGGVVTGEARAAFERARALDGKNAKARYFLGLAKAQDGDKPAALADWQAILAEAPKDSPLSAFISREVARLGGTADEPRGPDAKDVAAAQTMAPAERQQMIRGMVEGLAARLKESGGSREEWLRLVRAWSVLGERDKAVAAADEARKALAGSPDGLRALDDLARSLGLQG
jgi:cytochrome c-type biogenesis protein CcmH